jgi:hypothetical protein
MIILKVISISFILLFFLCSCKNVSVENNDDIKENNSIYNEPPAVTTSNVAVTTTVIATLPEPSIIIGLSSDWVEGENFIYEIRTEFGLTNCSRNFKLINDEVKLFSYGGDELNVIIPDYIDGMPVTMMNNHVFPTDRIYESITIGKNIRFINETNFIYCKYLENIYVHEENEYFSSVDGVLYNKDMSKLLVYPLGKTENEFTVPDGVKIIDEWAFSHNNYIEKIILSDSIEFFKEGGNLLKKTA